MQWNVKKHTFFSTPCIFVYVQSTCAPHSSATSSSIIHPSSPSPLGIVCLLIPYLNNKHGFPFFLVKIRKMRDRRSFETVHRFQISDRYFSNFYKEKRRNRNSKTLEVLDLCLYIGSTIKKNAISLHMYPFKTDFFPYEAYLYTFPSLILLA